jgi:hypothetical protein
VATTLISPRGLPFDVDDSALPGFLAAGYRQPKNPAELETAQHRAAMADAEGGATGAAKAGLEGAADALTFGGSSHIEKFLGVDPEAINLRSTLHPAAHAVGTGIGLVAPLVFSGGEAAPAEAVALGAGEGASTAARVARMTAPALTARLGEAVTGALAPEGAGALRTIAARGAGAAAEGAAVGAGDVVHDTAVSDDVTPGSALEHVALSAGFGGAAGAGLSGLGFAGAKSLAKARDAAARVRDTFVEWYPEHGAKLTGASEDDIAHILTNRQRLANGEKLEDVLRDRRPLIAKPDEFVPGEVPPEAVYEPGQEPARPTFTAPQEPRPVSEIAQELTDHLDEQVKATAQAAKEAGTEFRPAESAQIIDATVDPRVAQGEAINLAANLDELADKFRDAGPDLYDQGTAARLEAMRDGLVRDVTDDTSAAEAYSRINETKRLLYDETKVTEASPRRDVLTAREVRDVYQGVKHSLEDESVWGHAGARQNAFNAAFSEFKAAEKDFNAFFTRKVPSRSGGFERVPDNAKIEQFLKTIDEQKGTLKVDAFVRYQEASRALHDEIEKSAQAVNGHFGGIRSAMQRVDDAVAQNLDAATMKSVTRQLASDLDAAGVRGVTPEQVRRAIVSAKSSGQSAADRLLRESGANPEFVRTANATYDRAAAGGLMDRSTGAVADARANAQVAARAEAERAAQAKSLAEYREKVASFRGTEKERKEFARKALKEFKAAEDARAEASKQAFDAFKAATKAQESDIHDSAKLLRSAGRWNGFMDIVGAGAATHAPYLAPAFIGYRAMKYLGSPYKTAQFLAGLENTTLPSFGERLASAGYGRHILTQIAARQTPDATLHGIGHTDHEAALERPPRDVAEAIAHLGLADLLGAKPGQGKSLLHDVGTSVSPRLVEALGELQVKAYAQALGATDTEDVKRLLREAGKLGYGGVFTSADVMEARALKALRKLEDPEIRADTEAIVAMARAAKRANVDAGVGRLSADVVSSAWSHGQLAGMGAQALQEVRNRFGPELAAAMAPALRKAVKGPPVGLVPAGDFHEEQADTRNQMNDALGEAGGAPHVAASPETTAALAVLARKAEDVAKGVDAAAQAVVSGKVPQELRAPDLKPAEVHAMMDAVRRLTGDPAQLVEHLGHHTDTLADHAPQTGQAAAFTLSRAAQYLADALPKVRPPTLQSPEPGQPSRADTSAWGAKAQALLHPVETLAAGPSRDAAAALQAVYPSLWGRWRASTVNALAATAAEGKPAAFQTLQRVSTMIGQPLVPAQEPAQLAIRPEALQQTAPGPVDEKRRPVGSAPKFGSGELRTATQRVMAGGRS